MSFYRKIFDLIFSIECAVFRCVWVACEIYKDELQSCVLSPWLLSSLIWLVIMVCMLTGVGNSKRCSQIWKESERHSVVSYSLWPHELYSPWNSPGKDTGMGNPFLLQGIFPTQGSNPGLLHCRRILYHLSHKVSPRILEWIAYPFCSGSSRPRNWTRVSCVAGRFFTSWATRQALVKLICMFFSIVNIIHSWLNSCTCIKKANYRLHTDFQL